MFLPTTKKELAALGWDAIDIILVTGDTYIDSPFIGVAVIGKVLLDAGYRVGIIAQPDISSGADILRLGEPTLFWGVTGGCMDSMIANYTATLKKRKSDDLTPGGRNTRRPDRAVIAYTNLIRRYFKNTVPIVLGGIEASLRRISHYDYNTDTVRRSILFDAKADLLIYGMGEQTVLELAAHLKDNRPVTDIRGICHISSQCPEGCIELPPHADVAAEEAAFIDMFQTFYINNDPITAKGLCQLQDTRYLVHNPPRHPMTTAELDRICELEYEREVHPFYRSGGDVRALDTIRFSLATHRGCYGGCHFCAIAIHQGHTLIDRSEASILREATLLTAHPEFKGIIQDVGGPTANMYGIECVRKKKQGVCTERHCLTPAVCRHLPVSHRRQIRLLNKLRQIPGVRKVFIASGIRHDLILADNKYGRLYLEEIIRHHISGQLKIAPEHAADPVLELMGKPGIEATTRFVSLFSDINRRLNRKQYLSCYFIAAYPGCTDSDMAAVKRFASRVLGFSPDQVQVFTPSPSTIATLMYCTETDPFSRRRLFVEKDLKKKERQKQIVQTPARRPKPQKPRRRPS